MIRRALGGLVSLLITAGFLGLGVWQVVTSEPEALGGRGGGSSERAFRVRTAILEASTIVPEIATFGTLRSWRQADLASAASGRVVELHADFRDGGQVAAGQVLLRLDPEPARLALAEAQADLRDAEAALEEARDALEFSRLELAAAKDMAELRDRQFERQSALSRTGSLAEAALDNTRMEVAAAAQAVATRRLAVRRAETAIERNAVAIERAQVAQTRAARDLRETEIKAPFDGVLSDIDASLGDQVSANQALARLTDLGSLEVEIDLTAADFARLLGDEGRLLPQRVAITFTLGENRIDLSGHLKRAGAAISEAGASRAVYASIDNAGRAPVLRPGDFVAVTIEEPALVDVAQVPLTALDAAARLLVVDADSRLRETEVTVLRRQARSVLITDMPENQAYVLARRPQLGEGVLVESIPQAPLANEDKAAELVDWQATPDPAGQEPRDGG